MSLERTILPEATAGVPQEVKGAGFAEPRTGRLSRRSFLGMAVKTGLGVGLAAVLGSEGQATSAAPVTEEGLYDGTNTSTGEESANNTVNNRVMLDNLRLKQTPEYPDIPSPFAPSTEVQSLLDANPGSYSLQVYMLENINWGSIDWGARRDHWDPIPLAGIELTSRQMWAVAFNPIEIVSGLTFQVPERSCPSPAGGNYHPEFKDYVLEIWNSGQCGIASYPGCGYDSESLYIFAHQAFCVN